MPDKLSVLRACKRVLRGGGRLVCTAIFVPSGLSPAEQARAREAGPEDAWSPVPYAELFERAGFEAVEETDVSSEYLATATSWYTESQRSAAALEDLYGPEDFRQRQRDREVGLAVIGDGHLRRSLFAAVAPRGSSVG